MLCDSNAGELERRGHRHTCRYAPAGRTAEELSGQSAPLHFYERLLLGPDLELCRTEHLLVIIKGDTRVELSVDDVRSIEENFMRRSEELIAEDDERKRKAEVEGR